jgi:hypothetical protein
VSGVGIIREFPKRPKAGRRYRPGLIPSAPVCQSAFSFKRMSAWRYIKCAAAHLRYLGCKQKLQHAVNDNLGLEDI